MVTWRYEISLLVLKKIFHEGHEEKFCIFARPCNILYVSMVIFLTCKDNMLFTCEDMMFSYESLPGISQVFL